MCFCYPRKYSVYLCFIQEVKKKNTSHLTWDLKQSDQNDGGIQGQRSQGQFLLHDKSHEIYTTLSYPLMIDNDVCSIMDIILLNGVYNIRVIWDKCANIK